jgi:hypothetical protein
MSYQVAFCLWLLSFEQDVAEHINKYAYLPTLAFYFRMNATPQKIRYHSTTFGRCPGSCQGESHSSYRSHVPSLCFRALPCFADTSLLTEPDHEGSSCESPDNAGRSSIAVREECMQ